MSNPDDFKKCPICKLDCHYSEFVRLPEDELLQKSFLNQLQKLHTQIKEICHNCLRAKYL